MVRATCAAILSKNFGKNSTAAPVPRNNFPLGCTLAARLGGIDKGNKCRKELVGRVPSMFNSHAR